MEKKSKSCVHCFGGKGMVHPLYEGEVFSIVCDAHPLVEGHILLITREHVPAMGALSEQDFQRYQKLYAAIKRFVTAHYGQAVIFEHGISGQTVFHAHTHFLPCSTTTSAIIPDTDKLRQIDDLALIRQEYDAKQKYLYFENQDRMYLADVELAFPRFFRDILADILGVNEKADWQHFSSGTDLIEQFQRDIDALTNKWHSGKGEQARADRIAALIEHLHRLGQANDAEDHGQPGWAESTREESVAKIKSLLQSDPQLYVLLPDIDESIAAKSLLYYDWSRYMDILEKVLDKKN